MGIGNDLIGELEARLVGQVVSSRRLFRFAATDSFAHRFEQAVGRMYEGHNVLLLPSASMGLHAVLWALSLPPASEVLISPFGWVANFSMIRSHGLVPRFVGLDEDLQLTPAAVRAAISSSTRVLIVAHLMGRAQPHIGAIAEVCRINNIILLEDIAQAFGVRSEGHLVGTFGRAAYSSLNHHKILSTGDGGLLMTADQALLHNIHGVHDQGCVIEDGARRVPAQPTPGTSLRVNELTAAVALAQLTRFSLIKTLIWKRYRKVAAILSGIPDIECIAPNAGDLPYLCLFRSRRPDSSYPSLAESGWHSAANIPYLAAHLRHQMIRDAGVARTFESLSKACAVGSGFIDKYFAAPIGLSLRPGAGEVEALRQQLEARL